MVRLGAVALSLLLVCSALAQRPLETPISEMRLGPATPTLGAVKTSWNGESFLVTWVARESGGRAIRIDASGRPLDPAPIGLPMRALDVLWNGETWIVLDQAGWARVSREGQLVDAQPHAFEQPFGLSLTAVATDSGVIVAANDENTPLNVVTFDREMNVKSSRVIDDADRYLRPFLMWDGEAAVLLFLGDRSIVGQLLDADGRVVRSKEVHTIGIPVCIGSAGDGRGYVFVDQLGDSRMMGDWYHAYRLDHDLEAALQPESLGLAGFGQPYSDTLAWDGTAFTFAYNTYAMNHGWEARVMRISAEGVQLEDRLLLAANPRPAMWWFGAAVDSAPASTVLITMNAASPDAAPADCYNCALALENGEFYLHARAANDAAGLATAPEVLLESAALPQAAPAAASSNVQSLVAWHERLAATGSPRLLATRVANGSIRDAQSLLVSDSACAGRRPAIGSDGRDFLVAWYDTSSLRVARVTADGAVGEKTRVITGVPCVDDSRAPLVLSNGSGYLVVWTEVENHDETAVLAARVRADGTLIDSVPLVFGSGDRRLVNGASNGTDYLVTWDGKYARVTANGTILDPGGRFTGGLDVDAVWWNGQTYSLLHDHLVNRRISRIAANGVLTATNTEIRYPATPSWGNTFDPACDARGCSLLLGLTEGGHSVLRDFRAEDDGVTASIRIGEAIPVPPVVLLTNANGLESMTIAPLRDPNGRLFAAYSRRLMESPGAGSFRVFLRAMEQASRTRVVRH